MQPVQYSFNTYTVNLTSNPPTTSTTTTYNIAGTIQGVTRINLNYNLLNFSTNPYKITINWPNQNPIIINNIWVNNVIDPTLTNFQPNSAYSYTVLAPTTITPITYNSTVGIYYENGGISKFNISLLQLPDNIIDMDLNVLDVQNTDTPFSTIYNIQSNRNNVVYNFNDLINPVY